MNGGGVLQGTKLGVLLLLVKINDLKTRNPPPKFMDGTTLYESKPIVGRGHLPNSLNNGK